MSQTESLALPAQANAANENASFAYWQRRILITTIIGYALYYFVRKNLSVAMPELEGQLGIRKSDLGLALTAHGLLYGVSKFANGIVGDRLNARWFMASGLAICALINIAFGLSHSIVAFGMLWALNGWFQGIGFPPCARLMTHWFSPSELATKMQIWNSSHSIGAGLVLILCGYLAPIDWRLCFFVPAGIALVGAAWLASNLRDTPESLGMPPVEGTASIRDDQREPVMSTLQRHVFNNPFIWLLSFANFFVYSVRYGVLDWGPTFLKQARGMELSHAGWTVAAFEISGILGMLTSGWITDRLFDGRGARVCILYMTVCTVAVTLFWQFASPSYWVNTLLLCIAGFSVYGPQGLVGVCSANLATKRAAAAAVGLTGLFGYLSTVVSGFGIGWIVQNYGWDAGFLVFVFSGLAGIALFACCWPAKADGY